MNCYFYRITILNDDPEKSDELRVYLVVRTFSRVTPCFNHRCISEVLCNHLIFRKPSKNNPHRTYYNSRWPALHVYKEAIFVSVFQLITISEQPYGMVLRYCAYPKVCLVTT